MFHFEFPQNPRPCRIPGPQATFKSQISTPPPGNVFELIPRGCPGGCTHLELTETLDTVFLPSPPLQEPIPIIRNEELLDSQPKFPSSHRYSLNILLKIFCLT